MSPNMPLDKAARQIQTLDRDQCIDGLLAFEHIPLDFTRESLANMSTEQLRHVFMAAVITVHKYHLKPCA